MIEQVRESEASVAILYTREPEPAVLLIRRAERAGDPWSGHWSFPGGRRDPDDPDLLHTALRELEEECGIRLRREELEAALPPALARRKVGPFVLVSPFLFLVDSQLPAVPDPREAVEAAWVPLRILRDPARHALRPVPGRPAQMLFPTVDLPAVPLWGFTYRLITDWLGLDPKHRPLEQAGFEAATLVLNFLLARGLGLARGWTDSSAPPGMTAAVCGSIPVVEVLAHFSVPGPHIPYVNFLEVEPDYIRVIGLAFEEYLIRASHTQVLSSG